ncbi:MAG TPA: ABC transporter permease subunit [Pseudomonadota bacterium]|jgi:ABC-type transport system involved in multi-copper enzyme maturation permease subunit|nr:ABC transporter permease subunit [Pseudomonadota bacterium]HNN51439.1 ABC transporter permease subunit [Pseudomonadota bacterium]
MTERQTGTEPPQSRPRGFLSVARLDLAEVTRSRWLLLCLLLYGLLCVGFVFVGLRESSILGFAGTGRVLLSLVHALLLLLPLLALMATGQVIVSSRLDGTLELLFSHPLDRRRYFLAIALVRYLSLLLPLAVLLSLCCLLLNLLLHQPIPWGFLLRSLLVSASLLFAFTGLGLLISTTVRTQTRAMIYMLAVLLLAVLLLDFGIIGILLRLRLPAASVFVLSAGNPVQAARLALLSSVEPELSTLGPVGFYLANRLGSNLLLAVGIGWPALFGGLTLFAAVKSFRSSDLL